MITLEGLSREDCQICDLLWQCDTEFEVTNLIQMMPTRMQDRAIVLRDMILAAELDQVEEVADAVRDYLQGR
jgi:hypothetical protein